jgi:hypothetical protein
MAALVSVDVFLVLLGAAVGWIGSVGGSFLVGRHELARSARVRVYRELLPPIIDSVLSAAVWKVDLEPTVMQTLRRECTLAGKDEQRCCDNALNLWQAWRSIDLGTASDDEGNSAPDRGALAAWGEGREQLLTALAAFEDHLGTKLS